MNEFEPNLNENRRRDYYTNITRKNGDFLLGFSVPLVITIILALTYVSDSFSSAGNSFSIWPILILMYVLGIFFFSIIHRRYIVNGMLVSLIIPLLLLTTGGFY